MSTRLLTGMLFFTRLKRALMFIEISTVEDLSQPTKYANKILVSIFLTMKATILDTHDITTLLLLWSAT